MSKSIRISETGSIGFDLTLLEIYHTSVTASNLIASVSASLFTGSAGIVIDNLPDEYTTFYAKCISGPCTGTTASLAVIGNAKPGVRYFNVGSTSTTSEVSIITPVVAGPSTSPEVLEQTVNFNNVSSFNIQATPNYPEEFNGWYDAVESGSLWSTSSNLSITIDTFTGSDDFYAYFS